MRNGIATLAAIMVTACASSSATPPADAGPGDVQADAADAATADATDGGVDGSQDCPNDLPSSCPANAPSYANDVTPVLLRRCAPCHFPGGVEDSVHDFSTYAHVHTQAGAILGQIHGCLMPPPDAGQPTPDERAALQAWLVCGSPNN